MQNISSVPPNGALPMHEALRQFIPDELWKAFEAAKAVRSKLPRRPTYFSTSVLEWEAAHANYVANQARSAQADVEGAWAAIKWSLIDQLIAGTLVGFTQSDPPFGPWRQIPASSWKNLWIKNSRQGRVVGPNVDLYNVYIGKPGQTHSNVVMTGAPGQPSKSMHIIMDEWERRLRAGRIEPTRKAQAQVLLDWLKETHPLLPRPTEDTIYRRLPKGRWETSKKINCVEK